MSIKKCLLTPLALSPLNCTQVAPLPILLDLQARQMKQLANAPMDVNAKPDPFVAQEAQPEPEAPVLQKPKMKR